MKTYLTALAVTGLTFVLAGEARAQFGGPYAKLVDSWYHRYLGRHVDPIGVADHVHALKRGVPADFVEASILGSTEYYLRNGNTPEGFVLGLYRDVLGTAPAPGDLNSWVRRSFHMGSRHQLALRFLQENRVDTFAPGPVGPGAFGPGSFGPGSFGPGPRCTDPDPVLYPPAPVVVRPAPVVVHRPVFVAPPVVPAPVFVPPAPRPGVSIRLNFGR